MISSKFGFGSGKCNNEWHQLSSLVTKWICWKFDEMVVLSDLSEIVCKHKVWSKTIYAEKVCFPKDILPS